MCPKYVTTGRRNSSLRTDLSGELTISSFRGRCDISLGPPEILNRVERRICSLLRLYQTLIRNHRKELEGLFTFFLGSFEFLVIDLYTSPPCILASISSRWRKPPIMEEDRMGMRTQSETIEIMKDEKGLVGISIGPHCWWVSWRSRYSKAFSGGGHPFCPCVYVVQIFDKSPAEVDGRYPPSLLFVQLTGG